MQGCIRPARCKDNKDKWDIIIELPRDVDTGKRRQHWVRFEGKKRDAENEKARLIRGLMTGEIVSTTKDTVGDFLDRWWRDSASTRLTPHSAEEYKDVIENHLKPYLGDISLTKLHPANIQEFYAHALRSGSRKTGKGLSHTTVRKMHNILHGALKQAVKWGLISRNPCDAVDAPKRAKKDVSVLTEEQTARLLLRAKGTRMYAPILLATTTGMRRGEILALRWSDITFTPGGKGYIVVTRAAEETKVNGIDFKQPKSSSGKRTITMPSLLAEGLRSWKAEQNKRRVLLGEGWNGMDLVCDNGEGKYIKPSTFTVQFERFIATIPDMPRVTFHGLRHSHITHLIKSGVPLKVISARAGHASTGITNDIYGHLIDGMQEEAADKIDAALRGKMG